MRTMFMGTPDFGLGCLDVLYEKTDVAGVVSQPDRQKGRGHKLMPTPVKARAEALGIPVFQPERIKGGEFLETLKKLNPELIVVVAYGKILPEYILDYPKYGCINVHASLLPKLRGAAPIQRSIMNGDTMTGVTTMMMDKGLDTGDMLIKSEIEITDTMTGGELFDKLSEIGAEVLSETIDRLKDGSLQRIPQNHDEFTYAPMLGKETAHIKWEDSGKNIYNLVRALNPVPLAFTVMDGKIFKITECSYSEKPLPAGAVGKYEKNLGLPIGCGDGSVYIRKFKPQGKGEMSVDDYLRGHTIPENTICE